MNGPHSTLFLLYMPCACHRLHRFMDAAVSISFHFAINTMNYVEWLQLKAFKIEQKKIHKNIKKWFNAVSKSFVRQLIFTEPHLSKYFGALLSTSNECWNLWFLHSIFKLVTDINKGVIFSLLVVGAIFLALTLLNMATVNFKTICFNFIAILFCHFLNLSFSVATNSQFYYVQFDCDSLLLDFSIHVLLLCIRCHAQNIINSRFHLWFELVWLSTSFTAICYGNYALLTTES